VALGLHASCRVAPCPVMFKVPPSLEFILRINFSDIRKWQTHGFPLSEREASLGFVGFSSKTTKNQEGLPPYQRLIKGGGSKKRGWRGMGIGGVFSSKLGFAGPPPFWPKGGVPPPMGGLVP